MSKLMFALKGFIVGLCDLVPGVSGGTMAFLLEIYERLLNVIRNANYDCLMFWDRERSRYGWERLDIGFSIPFGVGLLIAIFSLAGLMHTLLVSYRSATYAFFFGLIISSAYLLTHHMKKCTNKRLVFLITGFLVGLLVSFLTVLHLPHTWWVLSISGFIASAAMLLPGVSGSYILLILGQYQYVIDAIHLRQFAPVVAVLIGVLIGLYVMSHVITYLLQKQHQITMFFLLGIIFGSLRVFLIQIGSDWSLVILLWVIIGIAIPVVVHYLTKRLKLS